MEGYIKLRVSSFYDFILFYLIIDEQNVIVYEKLDDKTLDPINIATIFPLKDGTIERVHNTNVKYGLQISNNIHPIGKGLGSKNFFVSGFNLLLSCDSSGHEKMWYVGFKKAINLHIEKENEEKRLKELSSVLLMNISDLTVNSVRKAYKKMSLKAHPDRGGDIEVFRKINTAYEELTDYCNELYYSKNSTTITYEAEIKKADNKIGFGLSIAENVHRKRCVVDGIDNNSVIISITAESCGYISLNDALIRIDGEDCSLWSKNRIKGRLSSARIPLGKTIVMTFERRIEFNISSTNTCNTSINDCAVTVKGDHRSDHEKYDNHEHNNNDNDNENNNYYEHNKDDESNNDELNNDNHEPNNDDNHKNDYEKKGISVPDEDGDEEKSVGDKDINSGTNTPNSSNISQTANKTFSDMKRLVIESFNKP